MSEQRPNESKEMTALNQLVIGVECLRGHIVDLEALAHSAASCLEHVPYFSLTVPEKEANEDVPAQTDGDGAKEPLKKRARTRHEPEVRMNMDRLQTLVHCTAESAVEVLTEANELIRSARDFLALRRDGATPAGDYWDTWSGHTKVVIGVRHTHVLPTGVRRRRARY